MRLQPTKKPVPVVRLNSRPSRKPAKRPLFTDSDIIGVLLLLVVISIAFSSYVVWVGTDGSIPKIMLLPQMFFAVWLTIRKFTKTA